MFIRSISKNLLLGFLIIFVALVFFSACSKQEAEAFKSLIMREPVIGVILKEDISDDLKESIEKEIKSWDEVKEVRYESKEDALENFNKDNPGSDLSSISIPASFTIVLKSSADISVVVNRFLEKNGNYIEGVDEVVEPAR